MDAEADPPTMEEVDPPPMEVIPVKCEIIEISDEEVNTEIKPRSRRKRPLDPNLRAKCDICDKIFGDKHQLRKHLVVHSEARPFICQLCGNTFRYKHTLKSHELTHSEDVVKKCVCQICGAAFVRNSSLKIHIKIHTGEKPYQCHLCPKTFIQKANLTHHIKVHQGERNFECTECAKKFITQAKLRQHSKKHIKKKLKELHMTSVQKVPKKRPPILPPKDVDTELSDENDDDECPSKVSNSPLWGSQVSDDESILS